MSAQEAAAKEHEKTAEPDKNNKKTCQIYLKK